MFRSLIAHLAQRYTPNPKPLPQPGLDSQTVQALEENLQAYHDLKAKLHQDATFFTIEDITDDLYISRIGGRGALPKNMTSPVDKYGNPLLFLAQINLDDIDTTGFHSKIKTGFLQFYVENSDVFGCHFPSKGNNPNPLYPTSLNGFRVLHIPKETPLTPLPSLEKPYTPFTWNNSASQSKKLIGDMAPCPPYPEDYRLQQISKLSLEILKDAGVTRAWHHPLYPGPEDEESEDNRPTQVYCGANPHFTQSDFREDYPNFTRTLLNIGFNENICIGDAGEMCFLSDRESLTSGQLDNILHYWDCF